MRRSLASCPSPALPASACVHALASARIAISSPACVTLIRSFSDEFKTRLLRVAAAVVYTPVNEHFGIVPIEAGASKRAVLATDTGGPLESVVDGTTGFLRHNTAPEFASAMSSIASDARLARRMGQAGAARAKSQFSRQAFGAQLEAICEHASQA